MSMMDALATEVFSVVFFPLENSDPESPCPPHSSPLIFPSVTFLHTIFSGHVIPLDISFISYSISLSFSRSLFDFIGLGTYGKLWAGPELYKESQVKSVICPCCLGLAVATKVFNRGLIFSSGLNSEKCSLAAHHCRLCSVCLSFYKGTVFLSVFVSLLYI